MLSNLPTPQPDQTLESYVSALQFSQAAPDRRSFINALFGGRRIEPGKSACSSIGRFFDALGNSRYSSPREIIEHHSLSALFQPFLPESQWEGVLRKQIHGPLNGLFGTLGSTHLKLDKADTHYCPACIRQDLAASGYAYAHRCHQIIGLTHCPVHDQLLRPLNKQTRKQYDRNGLLLVDRYHPDLLADPPEQSRTATLYQKALERWVERVYQGGIPRVSFATRCHLIRHRLAAMPRRPHVPLASPLQLEELLVECYGKAFLSDIGLPIDSGPTSHWPALLLWDVSNMFHPLTNLVILAALFPNPDTYVDLARNADDSSPEPATRRLTHHRSFSLSTALIRDLLRVPSLRTIAASHGTTEDFLREFLANAPHLQQRRSAALRRRAAQHHRRRIIQTVAAHPGLSRSELYRKCKSALDWAYYNDPEWLERQLPASRINRTERRRRWVR